MTTYSAYGMAMTDDVFRTRDGRLPQAVAVTSDIHVAYEWEAASHAARRNGRSDWAYALETGLAARA